MYPNKNTGLGLLMASALFDSAVTIAPTSGRVFLVAKSGITNEAEIKALYGNNYPDGTPVIYTTIALALAQCVASRGDIILVAPGHTESITNATDLNLNVAGVSVIGLGSGNLRPVLTLNTATTAIITLSAANSSFINMIVDGTGFAAVVSIFSVTAAGCKIQKCQITHANSTNQAGVVLTTTAGANAFTFDSNLVLGSTDSGTTNALQLVGGDNVQITNNYFYGAYTTSLGPINNITTGITRLLISGNTLINDTASSTKAIVLVSGTTGMISNNRIGILSGTAPITAAGAFVGGNYYAAAHGVTAGTLV